MLSILTLATTVHLLGSAEQPQGSGVDSNIQTEHEILNTLSEVYLNSPQTEYFGSAESTTYQYFEDVNEDEEDENWLFQAPEDSVDLPESDSEIYHKEIEYEMEEFDEEMERCWLVDEPDQACYELDESWSEELEELEDPDEVEVVTPTPQVVTSTHNTADRMPNQEKDLLSDLKTQFKRLIQYGYLDETDAVKSLLNGAFDHLLVSEENPNKAEVDDLNEMANHQNDVFDLQQNIEFENSALDVIRDETFDEAFCNIRKNKDLLRPIKSYHQNLLRLINPASNKRNLLRSFVEHPKKYLKAIESNQDATEITSGNLMVIDGTAYAFKDVANLQILDRVTQDSLTESSIDTDPEENDMVMDTEVDYSDNQEENTGSDTWEEYWDIDEDLYY